MIVVAPHFFCTLYQFSVEARAVLVLTPHQLFGPNFPRDILFPRIMSVLADMATTAKSRVDIIVFVIDDTFRFVPRINWTVDSILR